MARLAWMMAPALLAAALPASAQPRPTATIAGMVRDSAGHALEGAEVWLVGGSKTISGPDGAFRFDGLKHGFRGWIAARHIGHLPTQISLVAEPGTTTPATIVMATRPFELPELTVRAAEKSQRTRLIEFVWRNRGTSARFVSRDEIERSGATQLGQVVLRYLPFKDSRTMDEPAGMGSESFGSSRLTPMPIVYYNTPWGLPGYQDQPRVEWYAPAVTSMYPTSSQNTRSCPPSVAVNGGAPMPGWAVNDFRPEEVEALEISRGNCGTVVVWLKAWVNAVIEN